MTVNVSILVTKGTVDIVSGPRRQGLSVKRATVPTTVAADATSPVEIRGKGARATVSVHAVDAPAQINAAGRPARRVEIGQRASLPFDVALIAVKQLAS